VRRLLPTSATAVVADVVRPGDLLVAVCDNAHAEMEFGTTQLHWAVPDAVGLDTDEAFETAVAGSRCFLFLAPGRITPRGGVSMT
jgi:hypothetical protein